MIGLIPIKKWSSLTIWIKQAKEERLTVQKKTANECRLKHYTKFKCWENERKGYHYSLFEIIASLGQEKEEIICSITWISKSNYHIHTFPMFNWSTKKKPKKTYKREICVHTSLPWEMLYLKSKFVNSCGLCDSLCYQNKFCLFLEE